MLSHKKIESHWDLNEKKEFVTSLNKQKILIKYLLITDNERNNFFRENSTSTATILYSRKRDKVMIYILESVIELFFGSILVHEYFEGEAFRRGFKDKEFKRLAAKYIDYFKEAYFHKYDEMLDKSIENIQQIIDGENRFHYYAMLKEVEYVFEHFSEEERTLHQKDIYKADRLNILI